MKAESPVKVDMDKVSAIQNYLQEKSAIWVKMVKGSIDPHRYLRVMTSEIARSPSLLECTEGSILNCFLLAAELGLMPGSACKELYMVPFRNKNLGGKKEATPIIGYQGKIALATRHPDVIKIVARGIFAGEEDNVKIFYGTRDEIEHPYVFGIDRVVNNYAQAKKKLRGVYAIAFLKDNQRQFVTMDLLEIEASRARSKAKDDGPWVTDYLAMAYGKVVHRLMPFVPKTYEAGQAIQIEGAIENGRNPHENGTITLSQDQYRELVGVPELEAPQGQDEGIAAKLKKQAQSKPDSCPISETELKDEAIKEIDAISGRIPALAANDIRLEYAEDLTACKLDELTELKDKLLNAEKETK